MNDSSGRVVRPPGQLVPRTAAGIRLQEIVVHQQIEQWAQLGQQWTSTASQLGRSSQARHLRQRSLTLTTLLATLRKRLAEVDQLTAQIGKLVADEAAEEGRAA